MDGGGRLDQPLTRSGQSAAKTAGASVDEPDSARVRSNRRHHRKKRFGWFADFRRLSARWGAKFARLPLPQGLGVAGSILIVGGALGYRAVAGAYVSALIACVKGAPNV